MLQQRQVLEQQRMGNWETKQEREAFLCNLIFILFCEFPTNINQ
jgi:hypothetical protein